MGNVGRLRRSLLRLKTGACAVKLRARFRLYKIHNLWQLVIERNDAPVPELLVSVARRVAQATILRVHLHGLLITCNRDLRTCRWAARRRITLKCEERLLCVRGPHPVCGPGKL